MSNPTESSTVTPSSPRVLIPEIRLSPSEPSQKAIPDQYIIVFKPHLTSTQRSAHRAWASELHFTSLSTHVHGTAANGTYTGVISKFNFGEGKFAGYVARVREDVKREIEERSEEVDYIEPDYLVHISRLIDQRNVPSWGLARLSHRAKLTLLTRSVYTYDDAAAGQGVTAYIIDTGIFAGHQDFNGRAIFGYNAVPNSTNTDLNGHGTHVAGTIGGTIHGVSKKVTLVGVKVLGDNGAGSISTVINGLQWAYEDAKKRVGGVAKAVVNMSLGGGKSTAMNQAVKSVVNGGLVVVVAAGNNGEDAKDFSPASAPEAITVGASTITDRVAGFSNYGNMLDIFGPGVNITSTWIDTSGNGATNKTATLSGTSMASPHIAGLVAYLISKDTYGGLDTPAEVLKWILEEATKGRLVEEGLKGSVNAIGNNGERGRRREPGEGEPEEGEPEEGEEGKEQEEGEGEGEKGGEGEEAQD